MYYHHHDQARHSGGQGALPGGSWDLGLRLESACSAVFSLGLVSSVFFVLSSFLVLALVEVGFFLS